MKLSNATKLFFIFTLFALLLTGCASKPQIVTKTQYVQKEPLSLQQTPVTLQNINWRVIVLNGKPYYSLTANDYEYLSLNMKRLYNHINELNLIIVKYKEYYETPIK